jgi:hypothetical protein
MRSYDEYMKACDLYASIPSVCLKTLLFIAITLAFKPQVLRRLSLVRSHNICIRWLHAPSHATNESYHSHRGFAVTCFCEARHVYRRESRDLYYSVCFERRNKYSATVTWFCEVGIVNPLAASYRACGKDCYGPPIKHKSHPHPMKQPCA